MVRNLRSFPDNEKMMQSKHFRWTIYYVPLLLLLLALSACAPGSGIFAASSGNWQSTGLSQQHIHIITVNPNNAQELVAGDSGNNVYLTIDGGQHWKQQNAVPLPATTILSLAYDTTGKNLFVATDSGVYISADNGQHWQSLITAQSGLPQDGYAAFAFDSQAPMTVYVGSTHHGVFVSKNSGATWQAMNTGLPTSVAVNGLTLDSSEHQLWAATSMGVFRTDDRTVGWQNFNNGFPSDVVAYSVQPAFINGGAQGLVFVGTNHGFYLSNVAGKLWSASQESLVKATIYTVLVDVSQPTTVYVGTNLGAFRSNDNGQTWTGIASGIPRGQAVYTLVEGNTGGSQLYAASDDVYMYPGTSGGFGWDRIIPIIVILLFFYLLYRLTRGSRKNRRELLKPERIEETPMPAEKDDHPVS